MEEVANEYIRIGMKSCEERRYVDARDSFLRAIALQPQSFDAHFGLGVSLQNLGDRKGAIRAFSMAGRIPDQNSRHVQRSALALLDLGEPEFVIELVVAGYLGFTYDVVFRAVEMYTKQGDFGRSTGLASGVDLYDQFCSQANLEHASEQRHLSAMVNFLQPKLLWRERCLSRCGDKEFLDRVQISGLQTLTDLTACGRGAIIVNSHMAAARVVVIALARQGIPVTSIEKADRYAGIDPRRLNGLQLLALMESPGFALKQAYAARVALENGRCIHLAGDGYNGSGGIETAFLGRKRKFKTGFAELAFLTQSPVIPILGLMQLDGRLTVDICAPLKEAAPGTDRTESVRVLLDQYVSLLETWWERHPGNVAWDHVARYLKAPSVSQ